jgi:hypothetical protein
MTDRYYETAGDDIQDGYPQELTFAESNASFAGGIDEEGHLKVDDLYGVQKKTFYIKTPAGCTLEDLAANHKNGVFWQVPAEMRTFLKHVGRSTNRKDATGKDTYGELAKGLILNAQVISYHSTCPKDLAVDLPGLVPTYFSDTGRHNFVIPANSPNTVVKQNICEPDNLFTKQMYEKNQICSMKTLQSAIRFDIDPNKQTAHIATKTFPFKILCDNMGETGAFAEFAEPIVAKNKQVFLEAEMPGHQLVTVPAEIGKALFEKLAAPLKEIQKGYVDLNTYKARFTPVDGKAWNDVSGLIGESAVFGAQSAGFEVDHKLQTPFSAAMALEFEYVLNDE